MIWVATSMEDTRANIAMPHGNTRSVDPVGPSVVYVKREESKIFLGNLR
jgi:hypothetical protein